MDRLAATLPIVTPCTGICRIDQATRRCEGCARTLHEIAAWSSLSPGRREAIMRELPTRQ